MGVVKISDGTLIVSIEEVNENRPVSPVPIDALPDVFGNVVIYEKVGSLTEIPILGRVKSKAEAQRLEGFIDKSDLTMTERDGTVTGGWRIRNDPAPSIKRKDGDSKDFSVDFKLWRLP